MTLLGSAVMWFEKLASVRVRGFASAVQQEIYNSIHRLCVVVGKVCTGSWSSCCRSTVGGVKSFMYHVMHKYIFKVQKCNVCV